MVGQSKGHTAMHLHDTSARMIGRGRANYAKVIEDLRLSIQEQLDVLKTRGTYIERKVTSLSYTAANFAGGASVTMGIPDAPRNIFEAANVPSYHADVANLWETAANVGDSLFGKLKYIGTSAIDVTVNLDYSATTPTAGADPAIGRHFEIQLFVDDHDVSTANAKGIVICPSGMPIHLTANPLESMHTGSRAYTFRLHPNKVISAKVNTQHGSNVSACTVFTARIAVVNNTTTHDVLT